MNLIYTVVFTIAVLFTVSCSDNSTPVDQARKELTDVNDQLLHLAPADKGAAERFVIIKEKVHNVDAHLEQAQQEIERLNAEISELRPPEPKTNIVDKVAFWRNSQDAPKDVPDSVPAQ